MSVPSIGSSPSSGQIAQIINRQLNAPDPTGKPNMFQEVANLQISPQAKSMLETTMAQQALTLHQGLKASGQQLSGSQKSYIFNGAVQRAIMAYQQGSGSLDGISSALSGRGERIGATLAGLQSSATGGASAAQGTSTSSPSTSTPAITQ